VYFFEAVMNLNIGQLQDIISQAKKQYDVFKQKMATIVVEASAGGGMVSVRMNGEKRVLEVRLDPEVVRNDPDMLPDLIQAAFNEASRQIDDKMQSELGTLAGMPIPGLFG
jgi:DNA-binding YbaB/EbfC family protein